MDARIDTVNSLPVETMVGMFRRQVALAPQSIAVVAADGTLSYGELDARASAVAGGLRDRGVGPDDIVAVTIPRGVDMAVAVVAVLAAGAAYLPVDATQPPDRVTAVLADARPALVLTPGELRALETAAVSGAPMEDPDPACAAYVIYTSGSTGRPKGVVVPHAGIAHLVAAQRERFGARPGARVLQYASVGFDVAVADLCMALLTGATLVLAPPEGLPPGEPFARFIAEHGVTHVCMPPSALATQPDMALPSVSCLIVAGEAPGPDLVARWSMRPPDDQCLRSDRDDRVRHHELAAHRRPGGADRSGDPRHRTTGAGREVRPGRRGRAVHRRRRGGARLPGLSRADRAAVRRRPVGSARVAHVPHRRPGPCAAGR